MSMDQRLSDLAALVGEWLAKQWYAEQVKQLRELGLEVDSQDERATQAIEDHSSPS